MVADFAQGIQTSFLASMQHSQTVLKPAPAQTAAADQKSASKDDDGFSFDDLLDIINPLQHIPIVSTLYRHFTGDTIKPFEKIAGDTLFGGLTGLGSSLADFAFQKITGENFGDTVLAFFLGDDSGKQTAVAANTPPAQPAATHAPTPLQNTQAKKPASDALMAAIQSKGVAPDLAQRAFTAYQKSLVLPQMASATTP